MKLLIKIIFFFLLNINIKASEWIKVDKHKINMKQTEFIGIHCPDSLNCAAAANMGVDAYAWPSCRATTDGGKTWFTAFIDSSETIIDGKKDKFERYKPLKIWDFDYPDTSLCVISCDSSTYWLSRNKLKSWEKLKLNTNLNLLMTKFFSSKIGAIATYKELFLTKDGCFTWKKINFKDSVANYNILDVELSDTSTILLLTTVDTVMGPRQIFKSNDFGQSWEKIYQTNYLMNDLLYEKNNLWLAGESPNHKNSIFFSSNGGNTWTKKLDWMTKTQYGLRSIFIRENIGFAIGVLAILFYTSDHGNTWIEDTSYYYPNLNTPSSGLAFLTKYKILVTSIADGTIWMKDYSDITDIKEDKISSNVSNSMNIYPSPTKDKLFIRCLNNYSIINLQLFSLLGEKVYENNFTGGTQYEIDVSTLPPGIYFARIEAAGKVWTEKIIKVY